MRKEVCTRGKKEEKLQSSLRKPSLRPLKEQIFFISNPVDNTKSFQPREIDEYICK